MYIRTYIFLVVVYLFAVTVAFLIFSGDRCVPVSSVFLLVLAWSRLDAVHYTTGKVPSGYSTARHRSHLCPVPTPYSSGGSCRHALLRLQGLLRFVTSFVYRAPSDVFPDGAQGMDKDRTS